MHKIPWNAPWSKSLRRLTNNERIAHIKRDCVKRLDLLKCVFTVMLRLYRAIVRAKLDYGSNVCSGHCFEGTRPCTFAAITLSTGAFRPSPVERLYVESGEIPLVYHRSQLLIQDCLRTLNNTESPSAELVPGSGSIFLSKISTQYQQLPTSRDACVTAISVISP